MRKETNFFIKFVCLITNTMFTSTTLTKEEHMKNFTYFGGNSDVGTSVVGIVVSIVDGGGGWSVSSILLSSLSRPPSDELSGPAPFVTRLTGRLIFARRGRSLPRNKIQLIIHFGL